MKRTASSSNQQYEVSIRTVSIHDYSQLCKLEETLSYKEPIILIARITPLFLRNIEEGTKFVNKLHSTANKNGYTVFRLGEERIIIVPNEVRVQGIL